MVLCRAAKHRRPSYIDLLYSLRERDLGPSHSVLEGIEVHHHQIDEGDSVFLGGTQMGFVVAQAKQSPVNLWMESLHSAIHHLGETGMVAYVPHLHPLFAKKSSRTSRGKDDKIQFFNQSLGKGNQARLVADRN